MTPAAALLLAVAAAAAGRGRVLSVTQERAYLDAGSEEGLVAGTVVELQRNGRPAGTCRVEEVSDHHARCAGTGFRAGDAFAFAPRPVAPPKELPPPLPAAEQARRLAAVEAAPLGQVDFVARPGAAAAARPTSEVELAFAFWRSNVASPDQQAQLDVAIRDLPLSRTLSLSVDLSARRWISRHSTSFLPGPATQLLVWQAELDYRDPARPFSAQLGRVRPWMVHGAPVFDGARLGIRLGQSEVGVFGGLVPDPWSTAPTVERYQGGAWWSVEAPLGSWRLHHEGRLAYGHSPELGSRGELGATAGVWVSRALDVSAEVQVGAGTTHAPGYLEVARVAFSGRPLAAFSYDGGFGYVGLTTPGDAVVQARWPGPSRRADLTASLDLSRFFTLSVMGGGVQDLTSGLRHGWAGPELSMPRFFTPRLALSAGWLADWGWLQGQNAWLQVSAWPGEAFRLVARFSWYEDARPGLPSAPGEELGLYLAGSAQLTRWLAFKLSVLARGGLDFGNLDSYGFSGLASLAGGW